MNVYHKSLLFPRKSLSLFFFLREKDFSQKCHIKLSLMSTIIEPSRVLDPDQSVARGITIELIENDSLGFLTCG